MQLTRRVKLPHTHLKHQPTPMVSRESFDDTASSATSPQPLVLRLTSFLGLTPCPSSPSSTCRTVTAAFPSPDSHASKAAGHPASPALESLPRALDSKTILDYKKPCPALTSLAYADEAGTITAYTPEFAKRAGMEAHPSISTTILDLTEVSKCRSAPAHQLQTANCYLHLPTERSFLASFLLLPPPPWQVDDMCRNMATLRVLYDSDEPVQAVLRSRTGNMVLALTLHHVGDTEASEKKVTATNLQTWRRVGCDQRAGGLFPPIALRAFSFHESSSPTSSHHNHQSSSACCRWRP